MGRRALCLAALYVRGSVEQDVSGVGAVSAAQDRAAIRVETWLTVEGLLHRTSKVEHALLARPIGSWSRQPMVNASWRAEALGVLLWSLGELSELPRYDTQFDPGDLTALLPTFEPAKTWLRACRLRPADDVRAGRDLAELWHWRARTAQLQRTRPDIAPPGVMTLDEIIRIAAT